MVGRPRKIGKRERNGRIQRVYENPKAQVALQPHRIQVPQEYRDSAEAESEFGRLLCSRKITRAQYEAGKLYLDLASQYRAVKGYPPLHVQAIDLSAARGGLGRETPSHIIRAITDRYNSAFESICGQRAQKAVADYVVREQKISEFDGLDYLKLGLNDLVLHFRIDKSLRSVDVSNAT